MPCQPRTSALGVHTVQTPEPNRVWSSAGISSGREGKCPPTICSQCNSNFLLTVIKCHYIVKDGKHTKKYRGPNAVSCISAQLLSTVTSAPSSVLFVCLFVCRNASSEFHLLTSGNSKNQPFLDSRVRRAVWNGSSFSHRCFF